MAEAYSSWIIPETTPEKKITGLKVNNSLSPGKLVDFIPQIGNKVNWYMCGPTVYDFTHLGHARTYICSDVIKRLMRDYFGYDVTVCMNITDIDDKIIKRSQEENADFSQFARKWEIEYFKDMRALNVEEPDVLTRVSEYVEEIITFTQKIIDNGFAYESNGSVYFNVEAYKKSHVYGKLEPTAVNDCSLLNEGEGVLTNFAETDKKNKQDFVLWKKSKPGEPKWNSQWGEGRPGWHIECSTMAAHIFKCPLDIHTGGVDLKFPHHDNELAQSEAFYESQQWINYFLHTGHLHIEGLKMSKSLKNFITIKEMLKRVTSQQMRLLFLNQKYDGLMSYDESILTQIKIQDKAIREFFLNLKVYIRELDLNNDQKWNDSDKEFNKVIHEKKDEVHEALCSNFNTPAALLKLDQLMKATNKYYSTGNAKITLILTVQKYMKHIFNCFGLNYESSESENASKEEIITPYINAICRFRDEIKESNRNNDKKGIFDSCDTFRNEKMVDLGIRIEDRAIGEPSRWKYEDPETLKASLEEEKSGDDVVKKQKAKKEAEDKKKEQLEQSKIDPKEMFLSRTEEFSKFDETGFPTHDKEGNELTKNKVKGLKKVYEKQVKLYAQYVVSQSENK